MTQHSTTGNTTTRFRSNNTSKGKRQEAGQEGTEEEDASSKIVVSFQQKCDWIAKISEEILQDPQNAFASVPCVAEEYDWYNLNLWTTLQSNERGVEVGLPKTTKRVHNKIKVLLEIIATCPQNIINHKSNDESSSSLISSTSSSSSSMQQEQQERNQLARLAMVSLLAIFSDILPSYRIRLPTHEELSVRVSKETKATWDYERNLLSHYQSYWKLLQRTWEQGTTTNNTNNSNNNNISLLTATSMLCTCELLKSAMHFNFRSNILHLVVRSMNFNCKRSAVTHSSSYPSQLAVTLGGRGPYQEEEDVISIQCCEAISYIFQTDKQGDISLEAVRSICKLIKDSIQVGNKSNTARSRTLLLLLHPRILQTFLHLPLRIQEEDAEAVKLHTAANAKRRKRNREEATIEQELKEGNASLDKALLARSQAESLHLITLAYFRIIKKAATIYQSAVEVQKDNHKTHHHQKYLMKQQHHEQHHIQLLLPVTLQGLAKFAHLINIDTVVDLLAILKDLLTHVDKLPLDAAFHCILTAFQTLSGPGKELQIDPKEYVTPLFAQLPRLASLLQYQHTNLALSCLDEAFIRRKDYSLTRVAAFCKQILTVSLHTPYCSAIPFLAMVQSIFQSSKYSTGVALRLLENELDNATLLGGAYNPWVATDDNNMVDPESINPFATSAWELGTLRFHIHPLIAQQAEDCAQLKLTHQGRTPVKIYHDYLHSSHQGYIPNCKIALKRHPLRPPPTNERSKRKRGPQIRFITPRNTKLTHLHGGMDQYL
jgi:nucleolar complex protein 3